MGMDTNTFLCMSYMKTLKLKNLVFLFCSIKTCEGGLIFNKIKGYDMFVFSFFQFLFLPYKHRLTPKHRITPWRGITPWHGIMPWHQNKPWRW